MKELACGEEAPMQLFRRCRLVARRFLLFRGSVSFYCTRHLTIGLGSFSLLTVLLVDGLQYRPVQQMASEPRRGGRDLFVGLQTWALLFGVPYRVVAYDTLLWRTDWGSVLL